MDKTNSVRTFVILIVVYALLAAASLFLPQGTATVPAAQSPFSLPVLALANGLLVLLVYGGLGLLGLLLARKLGLPEIWDAGVSNRQRFLLPGLVGAGTGILIIAGDLIFAPINGVGRLPHPPFPTSVVASLAAGIGEETIFRLFFISFWTWLIAKIILRGRLLNVVYGVVSIFSAVAFAMSHIPSLMYLQGWTTMNQVPPMLILELLLLNGSISIFAAYYFRKSGFLAPVGVHLWADVVWHVLWGLL